MRGIDVPPREDDFTADPAELFFDLAFVFAFSRLVYLLVHEPNWSGVGEFALLFTLIWLPWTQFTWSANAVSGNDRKVRAGFLVATVASIPMAASVTTALGDGGFTFAIPVAVILGMGLVTMIAGLGREHAVYASIVRYSIPNLVAMAVLIIGAFVDHDVRVAMWCTSILVVVYGTIRAAKGEWLVRPGHFAERHGLILIVALGEVVVAVGVPVVEELEDGAGLPGRTVGALVAAGAFACLLWWSYFDRVNPALEHRHQAHDAIGRGPFARDVYTYAHLPIIAGVILMAAALEEITLHPAEVLPTAFRWMLLAGMTLFFGGMTVAVWRAFHVVAKERVAALALLLAPTVFGASMSGLTLLIITDVLLVVVLVAEHVRIEGRPDRRETSDEPRPT